MFVAAIMLSVFVLSGCAAYKESAPHSAPEAFDEERIARSVASVVINLEDAEISDFTAAIIGEINTSRSMSEAEHRDHGNYRSNKIPEITEFYSPIEIEGFVLSSVSISEHGFAYYYYPVDMDKDATLFFHHIGIEIVIERLKSRAVLATLTEIATVNNSTLTEDGFVYDPGNILAPIDDAIFRISIPVSLDTPDFLRDLALQVIETAELVTV
jgi:hypothetical protein